MNYHGGPGRPRSSYRQRSGSSSPANYPAIGHPRFSFNHLMRQTIETKRPVQVELMTGENLQAALLREDQFTVTVLVEQELRIVYKHAIKAIVFSKE